MFGFAMGGVAGLIQANVGLNVVYHNTQWAVALHAHTFLLTGVGTMLFAVLYALVPMMTKMEFKSKALVNAHLWLWLSGSIVMAYVMGMAGSEGMLRRTIYMNSEFSIYTLIAVISGVVLSFGLVAFLINLVNTLGLRSVLSLFIPERFLDRQKTAEASA